MILMMSQQSKEQNRVEQSYQKKNISGLSNEQDPSEKALATKTAHPASRKNISSAHSQV